MAKFVTGSTVSGKVLDKEASKDVKKRMKNPPKETKTKK